MSFFIKIKEMLDSKKWYMTILGSVLVMVGDHYGVSVAVLSMITGLFGSYVVGQGVADLKAK